MTDNIVAIIGLHNKKRDGQLPHGGAYRALQEETTGETV